MLDDFFKKLIGCKNETCAQECEAFEAPKVDLIMCGCCKKATSASQFIRPMNLPPAFFNTRYCTPCAKHLECVLTCKTLEVKHERPILKKCCQQIDAWEQVFNIDRFKTFNIFTNRFFVSEPLSEVKIFTNWPYGHKDLLIVKRMDCDKCCDRLISLEKKIRQEEIEKKEKAERKKRDDWTDREMAKHATSSAMQIIGIDEMTPFSAMLASVEKIRKLKSKKSTSIKTKTKSKTKRKGAK